MLMRRKTFAASATNPNYLTHHNSLQEPRKVLLKTWKGPEETWDTEIKIRTVRELTEDRTGLLQQLAAARAQPPSVARNSPEVAFTNSGGADAQIRQLQQECERLNQEGKPSGDR